jgi:hypothetical protein
MGNDVAQVGQLCVFKIRGIETKELGFADLLSVAEKLITVLQSFIPGLFELGPGGLAFDDEQRLTEIIFDENIGPTTAGTTTELPFWFQFDVVWLVSFRQQTMDALKDDKIFIR